MRDDSSMWTDRHNEEEQQRINVHTFIDVSVLIDTIKKLMTFAASEIIPFSEQSFTHSVSADKRNPTSAGIVLNRITPDSPHRRTSHRSLGFYR